MAGGAFEPRERSNTMLDRDRPHCGARLRGQATFGIAVMVREKKGGPAFPDPLFPLLLLGVCNGASHE